MLKVSGLVLISALVGAPAFALSPPALTNQTAIEFVQAKKKDVRRVEPKSTKHSGPECFNRCMKKPRRTYAVCNRTCK